MRPAATTARLLLPVALLALAACRAEVGYTAGGGLKATPQRPTPSFTAATVAEDAMELEAGVTLDPGDRVDTPVLFKYGAGPRTELFLGVDPLVWVDRGGSSDLGFGDTAVGVRHRFLDETEDRPATALALETTLPTGSESKGISSGENNFNAVLIATKDIDEFVVNGNLGLGVLGDPGGGSDMRYTLTAGGAHHTGTPWTPLVDVVMSWIPEQSSTRLSAYFGTYYEVSPGFVVDVDLRVGLTSDAPGVAVLIGLTDVLGQLYWRDR